MEVVEVAEIIKQMISIGNIRGAVTKFNSLESTREVVQVLQNLNYEQLLCLASKEIVWDDELCLVILSLLKKKSLSPKQFDIIFSWLKDFVSPKIRPKIAAAI